MKLGVFFYITRKCFEFPVILKTPGACPLCLVSIIALDGFWSAMVQILMVLLVILRWFEQFSARYLENHFKKSERVYLHRIKKKKFKEKETKNFFYFCCKKTECHTCVQVEWYHFCGIGSRFYKVLKKSIKEASCSSVRWLDSFSNSFWFEVNEKLSSSVEKNCESVIPNALHIFSREGIEGTTFFLYHEEIVDCVRPDFSASWYSVQFFCFL